MTMPNTPKLPEDWQTEFDKWFNHGTKNEPRFAYSSGVYPEVKAFIQDLLDRKAEEIEGLKKPIKHSNCVRDYDHCECHDWEKKNNILDQVISILKEE